MSARPSVTVRLAREADAEAIAEIYNQGIAERIATFETQPRTPEHIVTMLRERGDRYPTVVAEQAGRVVAWASAGPYSSRSCYSGIAEFSVYTRQDYRGAGIGRAALWELIRVSEQRGFWKLLSRIFVENDASRRLCRNLGFREVGVYRRHAQLDGVWRNVVIVEILLGEAALR